MPSKLATLIDEAVARRPVQCT